MSTRGKKKNFNQYVFLNPVEHLYIFLYIE